MTDKRVPPEWLTQEYMEEKLRIGLKSDKLKITEYDIKPAVPVGENAGSLMFRLTLKVKENNEEKKLSLVVKTLTNVAGLSEITGEANVFGLESSMYQDTLPRMQKMLDEVAPGKFPKLFADMYYSQNAPNYLIVLEDLCESGYKTPDAGQGLDLNHSLHVLENLGRFHACSYVLTQKNPSVKEHYREYFYCPSKAGIISKMVNGGFASLLETATTWTDMPPKYLEKLQRMQPTFFEKMLEAYKRDDNYKYNVILHGDLWRANMMFKHEEDQIAGWKMIDFQTINYNSPALDLNYFIFASPRQEVREEHLELLLKKYYNGFREVLNVLRYQSDYSFVECKKEFFRRLMFGFYSCLLVLAIQSVGQTETIDFDDLFNLESKEFKNKHLFKREVYTSIVKKMLPFFEEHGVL